MIKKIKFFLIVKHQQINVKKMKLENHHLINITVKLIQVSSMDAILVRVRLRRKYLLILKETLLKYL